MSHAGVGLASPEFLIPVGVGLAAIIAFALVSHRSAHPVFPLRLLAHPAFLAAVIAGIGFNLGGAALSIMTSNVWQYVVHMPTSLVGIGGVPTALAAIGASLLTGVLVKRGVSSGILASAGLGAFVLAYAAMLVIGPDSPYAVYLPAILLSGAGSAITSVVQGGLFLRLAPAAFYGPVTSSRTMFGQFGYSLGLTGATMLVNSFTERRVHAETGGAVGGGGDWDAITTYLVSGETDVSALDSLGQPAVLAAYTDAVVWTSGILAVIFAAMAVAVLALLRTRRAGVGVEQFIAERPIGARARAAARATTTTTTTTTTEDEHG